MITAVKSLVLGMLVLMLFKACEYHDIVEQEVIDDTTDERLFAEATDIGFTYYKDGNLLPLTSQSPHGMFKLRFNAVAAAALGQDGELPENGQFPNGSIVVKEVYQNSTLNILAVMKRVPSNVYASERWIWAEYHLDGRPAVSIEHSGKHCVSCHQQAPNRDLVRTFDFH